MTAKELKELVNNFASWGGNTFTLAMMVMQKQREDDAVLVERLGYPEVSEVIKAAQ